MTKQTHSVILGAGPVGRAIAHTLVAKGHQVTVVTRDGRQIAPGVTPRKADLSDAAQTVAVCDMADQIYLCAAPPYQQWQTDFSPLQEAAIAAAQSTNAVLVVVENLYGYGVAGTLREDMPLSATTRKGAVRAQMSQTLLAAHAEGRAKCVAGRATDFFGPGVRLSALGERLWPALLAGKTVDWIGDPDAPHSFAYLPDLAHAYATLAETPSAWGQAWHLPALPPISIREICDMTTAERDKPARIRQTPSWLLRAIGLFQPAAGEMVEMRYMFDAPFIIDHAAFDKQIGTRTHTWDTAMVETVAWWQTQESKAN